MNPYRVNARPAARLTVMPYCVACRTHVAIEVPADWWETSLSEAIDFYMTNTLKWVRRLFTEDVNIWFCSVECAYYSAKAIEVEKHWKIAEAIWESNK